MCTNICSDYDDNTISYDWIEILTCCFFKKVNEIEEHRHIIEYEPLQN